MVQFNLRRRIQCRVSLLRRLLRRFWTRILHCSGKPRPGKKYQILPRSATGTALDFPTAEPADSGGSVKHVGVASIRQSLDMDSDVVALKISLLGDEQTGKTSFLVKLTGNEMELGETEKKGLNVMDKTLDISGARISYSIWEVEGDEISAKDHIFQACSDSVAILFMFDLTSRCTLNGVIRWYQQARKWNQRAIPILVGTKFDDFIKLPIDLQWAVANQARAYAKALKATLFFSSANYNINVNKIFKFITAKIFDLPWTLERNLTIGEPIIDY